jgi:hypothetical protein
MEQINAFAISSNQDNETVTEETPVQEERSSTEQTVQEQVTPEAKEEAPVQEEQKPPVVNTQTAQEQVTPEAKEEAPVQEEQKPPVANTQTATPPSTPIAIKMAELTVEEMLQPYLEAMKPNRPITTQAAAEQTQSLYRIMESIFRNNDTQDKFNAAWSRFLSIVKQYREDHFHETRVYRGVPQWNLGNSAYTKFTRLIQLALETCQDGANSKFFKTINTDKFFTDGFSESEKQKIMGFYRIG